MDPATTTTGAAVMSWISAYGYLALLPLFVIEGPVVGITSGVLISVGLLRPVPVLFLYVVGTIITDSLVYYAAKHSNTIIDNTAVGRWLLGRAEWVIDHADTGWREKFTNNYTSLMVLAKLAPINLLATFVAVGAGMLKISARRFYKPIILTQPVWSAAVVGLGYYLGDAVQNPDNLVSDIALTTLAVAGFLLVYHQFLHEKIVNSPLGRFIKGTAVRE